MPRGVLFLMLLALLALALLDLGQLMLEPNTVIRTLPGVTRPLSGKLHVDKPAARAGAPEADPNRELTWESNSRFVSLRFHRLQGRIWSGMLEVRPDAEAGVYSLRVGAFGAPRSARTGAFQIRIFPNAKHMREDYPTFSQRALGMHPAWIVLALLLLCTAAAYASSRESTRIVKELQDRGIGAIYRLDRKEAAWEISFTLGSDQGVSKETPLHLLDSRFHAIGRITPHTVREDHSVARIPRGQYVKMNCYVSTHIP